MQTYEDLGTGRFAIIADFERPVQMQLFQLAGVSDESRCVLANSGGRAETGAAALHFTAGCAEDAVIVSNRNASEWYLKRDWRNFDLLLMSILSPVDGVTAEVTLGAGSDDHRRGVYSSTRLHKGWNQLRLDLAEVAEQIPLDDIREIQLSVGGEAFPISLVLDDIILANNQVDMLGDSRNTSGELYVRTVGRRLRVGAGGRFEIGLGNGQIVSWYDLRRDPNRVRNLVRDGVLGPLPFSDGTASVGDEPGDDSAIAVRQKLMEMSPVRVVVVGEWRRVNDAGIELPGPPLRRWAYTIYPSGQIYVDIEAPDPNATSPDHVAGLAVTLTAVTGDGVQTRVNAISQENLAIASARSEVAGYLLLFALATPVHLRADLSALSERRRTVTLVASRPASQDPRGRWSCKLLLGDAETVSDDQVSLRALAYAEPSDLQLATGSIVTADDVASTGSGFDHATGCYRLRPDNGYLRYTLKGRRRPLFSPAFVINDSREREAWVYVNHILYEAVARDAHGDLIFQLPGVIEDDRTIEVLVRRSQQPPGA